MIKTIANKQDFNFRNQLMFWIDNLYFFYIVNLFSYSVDFAELNERYELVKRITEGGGEKNAASSDERKTLWSAFQLWCLMFGFLGWERARWLAFCNKNPSLSSNQVERTYKSFSFFLGVPPYSFLHWQSCCNF